MGVLDTGINYSHPDLTGNIWVNSTTGYHGWNFTGGSNNNLVLDSWGHGTHVAGTIGALTYNGVGVAGVSWDVRLMSLKIFQTNSGSTSTIQDAINAIHFADVNGVAISSNSWSGPDTSPPLSLKDAIDASPQLFITAAGNSANNIETSPEYPAALTSNNIISVAASDQNDQLALFSNWGPVSVDLAAPGVNMLNTACANFGVSDPQCGYYYMSGTSMATPQVSGVAALIKSVNPRLTNIQIKNIILNNVDVLQSLSGKVKTNGRLNASKAMLAAQSTAQPDKIGVYKDGGWYLDYNGDGLFTAGVDKAYGFGAPQWTSVIGDWNADGKTEIGVYKDGGWYLDYDGDGLYTAGVDKAYGFGAPLWTPAVGKWS